MISTKITVVLVALALLGLLASMAPRPATWWGWSTSLMLLPRTAGVFLPAVGLVDSRFIALVLLTPVLGLAWLSDRWHRRGLQWTDWLVLGLGAVMIISTFQAEPNYPLTAVQLPLMHYVLPYLVGRIAVTVYPELTPFFKATCLILLVLLAATFLQFTTGFNVFSMLSSKLKVAARMGMTRATGPLNQPLYLAMLLFPMLAIGLAAAGRARAGQGPGWWKLLPWLVVLGILATVSRGPFVLALAAVGLFIILGNRSWRIPLLMVWIGLAGLSLNGFESISDFLYQFEQKSESSRTSDDMKILVIDGTEYKYSGATHRALAFKVYEKPLANAGLVGYGPDLKGVNIEENLLRKFWTLDNSYLSITLRYGYLGMGLFLAIFASTLYQLHRLHWGGNDPRATYARALFAVLLTQVVALYGVGITPEFSPAVMYVLGLATNLTCLAMPAPVVAARVAGVPRIREALPPTAMIPLSRPTT